MNMIENAYWVDEGKVLAGPYPRHPMIGEETGKQLAWLCEQGITHIIDLTGAGERASYREEYRQVCQRYSIPGTWERFPIVDFGLPDKGLMREIQDEIQRILDEDGKVYIHCYAGIGRTGTVAGCYLVERGMSGEEALEKLQTLRKPTPHGKHRSPENDTQRDFVLQWNR